MDGGHANASINLHKEFIHPDPKLDPNLKSVSKEFITAENIEALLQKHNVPPEPDLISIDLDGNRPYK